MSSMKRDHKSGDSQICWRFEKKEKKKKKKKVDQKMKKWLSQAILKLAVKKLHFKETDFEIYESVFGIFGKKLILKHFSSQ